MKRLGLLCVAAILAIAIVGCANDSASSEPAPKGTAPETIEAPPGAQNPEQRAKAEQGNTSEPQDGGGQDGT